VTAPVPVAPVLDETADVSSEELELELVAASEFWLLDEAAVGVTDSVVA